MGWFFFQAEDGIRDIGVTGVQTCALPIWTRRALSQPGTEGGQTEFEPEDDRVCPRLRPAPSLSSHALWRCFPSSRGDNRSEERRVGKECRSRWSPDH